MPAQLSLTRKSRKPRTSTAAGGEARNSKRAFAVENPSPPAPRRAPRSRLREGERGAITFDGAQEGGEPARIGPSWRRRRARHEPERSREADESRGPDPSGQGNAENEWNPENECRGRLRSPARRRARRLRRGQRAHEAQPLEQGPPRLAPGVHSHEPPPAAAARTRTDVEGEHPAQQRRPTATPAPEAIPTPPGSPPPQPRGAPGITADRHAACGASTRESGLFCYLSPRPLTLGTGTGTDLPQ